MRLRNARNHPSYSFLDFKPVAHLIHYSSRSLGSTVLSGRPVALFSQLVPWQRL